MLTIDTVVRVDDEPTSLAQVLKDPDTMDALVNSATAGGITPTEDTDELLEALEEFFDDERLLRDITGDDGATVCDALTVDDQRMEDLTRDAFSAARLTLLDAALDIIDGRTGHGSLDLPVYDDEPISDGLYIYADPATGTHTITIRWATDRADWPAAMRDEEPRFATLNRDNGTYGDIDTFGLQLTDKDRHVLAEWVAAEVQA